MLDAGLGMGQSRQLGPLLLLQFLAWGEHQAMSPLRFPPLPRLGAQPGITQPFGSPPPGNS